MKNQVQWENFKAKRMGQQNQGKQLIIAVRIGKQQDVCDLH